MKYVHASREVKIPADQKVSFKVNGKQVEMKGPKGTITRDFSHARNLDISAPAKDTILLETRFPRRADLAIIGTIQGHIQNMIVGVTSGYKYKLKIVYAHFPITVKVNKDTVEIQNFIGERGFRIVPINGDVKITATKEDVTVEGIDKDIVGQNAANIQRRTRIIEKDLRVFQDGIYVYEKWAGERLFWHIKM